MTPAVTTRRKLHGAALAVPVCSMSVAALIRESVPAFTATRFRC
jgi:hypothetical protein